MMIKKKSRTHRPILRAVADVNGDRVLCATNLDCDGDFCWLSRKH